LRFILVSHRVVGLPGHEEPAGGDGLRDRMRQLVLVGAEFRTEGELPADRAIEPHHILFGLLRQEDSAAVRVSVLPEVSTSTVRSNGRLAK